MRISFLALGLAALFPPIGSGSLAATVVQSDTAAGMVSTSDGGADTLYFAPFDVNLGLLESVTLEVSGGFTPAIAFNTGTSGQVTLTTDLAVSPPLGDYETVGVQQITIPLGKQSVSGAPATFDQTFFEPSPTPFLSTTFPGSQVSFGLEISTLPTQGGSVVDAQDDETTFSGGAATLTYTYAPIPEPTSAAMVVVGLLGLIRARVRRSG